MQTIKKIDSTIINFIDQPNTKNYINFYTTLITANDNLLINLGENISSIKITEFIKKYKNHRLVGLTTIPEELINELDELKQLTMYTLLAATFFRHDTAISGLQHTVNSLCLNKSPSGKYSDIRWFLLGEIFKNKDSFHLLKMPQRWMTSLNNPMTPSPSYCYSQAILRNPYLIPAWQRLHDIFSVTVTTPFHYFPDFAASGLVDNTNPKAIQHFCSINIKNIDPMASNSHYQFKTDLVRPSQLPQFVNYNTKPPASFQHQSPYQLKTNSVGFFQSPAIAINNTQTSATPNDLPQAIIDFITKIKTIDRKTNNKPFVELLKGDFPSLKLAIRSAQDLRYISTHIASHMARPGALLSFIGHFITHPKYIENFRQCGKDCDTTFLKRIFGNNKHDITNNINIVVGVLSVGGETLKPQQSIRKRLEAEVITWKIGQFKGPACSIARTVKAPVNTQPVANAIQPMIIEIEGGEYEDAPIIQRAPVSIEAHQNNVPVIEPIAAIVIEEGQPMIMEIEGGEYEDGEYENAPVVQRAPINIETHQEIDPKVDASPLPPIDLLSTSADSVDNDDSWLQSSAFHFFAAVKMKNPNQEMDMDTESTNTKRNRDTSNDCSESPNKRKKM